jgi:ankyrin repeat protein
MNLTRRQALAALAAPLFPQVLALPRWSPRSADDVAAFLAAVQSGALAEVRRMLAADASLARARDARGRSAFVLAHLAGHGDVAQALRATGLELDVVEAVLAEDWPRVTSLATAAPELCAQAHPIGGTPLYAGALCGIKDLYRLRTLGCRPDAAPAGGSGLTAARAAMECRTEVGARCAATDVLANGGDVNAAQREGDSVLHGAVRRRSAVLVRLAIRKGADVAHRDAEGRTARDLAAELGWREGTALLDAHASLPRDCRQSRFLFGADGTEIERPDLSDVPQKEQNAVTGASHGNTEKVRELLARDPRLTFSVSTDDELAIEASAHTGNHDAMRLHLDHGAPLSLPTAVSLGEIEHMRFLLDAEPRLVHERGAHDFPVLWYAAIGTGSVEVAEVLHGYCIDLDQESVGTTALHWCIVRDREDLGRWLIDSGAALEPTGYFFDRGGQTPLQLARARGHDAFARMLLDAGAKV